MINITNADLDHLIMFVKTNFGIDLSHKRTYVEIKLHSYMLRHNYTNYSSMFNKLCADPTGMQMSDFASSLAINYTLFNRESVHFDFLKSTLLPELKMKLEDSKTIYSWSAGCSSGEEPYTMAMVFYDFFNIYKKEWDTKILATDISTSALKKASEAKYPIESVEKLSRAWINKYFEKDINDEVNISVSSRMKDEVIFRNHNLINNQFIFKNDFNFIFCRNVMIYFDEATKNKLIQKFYHVLQDGGYLFVGLSETIDTDNTQFEYVKPSIYRKVVKKG